MFNGNVKLPEGIMFGDQKMGDNQWYPIAVLSWYKHIINDWDMMWSHMGIGQLLDHGTFRYDCDIDIYVFIYWEIAGKYDIVMNVYILEYDGTLWATMNRQVTY